MKADGATAGKAAQRIDSQAGSKRIRDVERQRSQLLYFAMVMMLVLGIGVVVYAFSFEVLGTLFSSDYFNNVVRFSFALLLVMTVAYLVLKERDYTSSFDSMVGELESNMEELKDSLEDVSTRLEVSRMVAISEDLHEKLEKRFPGMKNHWKRTAYYAAETARRMELDEHYVRQIEKAGELMDIGMLRFGEDFRIEAVELNPWEKEMVRRHPLYSVEVLSSVRPDWEILPLVRHHHEWWNGMGYPDGLKGEAIPLGARILQLADAFVAMTSYRAYKGTREAREALAEIEDYSGVQFDPRVVKAFTAFMAPRVFLEVDCDPSTRPGDGRPTMPLTGKRDEGRKDVSPGANGTCVMDALEVEDLFRDISL